MLTRKTATSRAATLIYRIGPDSAVGYVAQSDLRMNVMTSVALYTQSDLRTNATSIYSVTNMAALTCACAYVHAAYTGKFVQSCDCVRMGAIGSS